MENVNEFLKKLALVTDIFDNIDFVRKTITTTIALNKEQYDIMYVEFNKDKVDIDGQFSILIDKYEFIITKEV